MTPEKIDAWLASIEKDRTWLAHKLGISMGTLYNGFSKGFPQRSIKAITSLMNDSSAGSDFEVSFTASEFERIEEARRLLGIATRKLFYEEAINEYAEQILAREASEAAKTQAPANISPIFTSSHVKPALVAETEARYKDKTGTED